MPAFKKVKKGIELGPRLLNEDVIEKIANSLRLGHYIETAVVMAGVKKDTFYKWIYKAHEHNEKNKTSIYTQLLQSVEKAQGEAETRDLLVIDKCANGRPPKFLRDEEGNLVLNENGNPIFEERGLDPDWHASAWRLERRFPKKWGSSSKLEVTGIESNNVNAKEETQEEKQQRLERIRSYAAMLEKINATKSNKD